jgi:hypothetical protein
MKAALLAMTSVLALALPALADEQCAPLKIVSSVDLKLPKNGPALVPVSIGGQPFLLRLSTDGWQSTLSSAAIDQLALMRRDSPIAMLGTDGNYSNSVAIANDFQIGTARYGKVQLRQTIENPPANAPQGMVTNDLLRAYDVDLDFAASKMNLVSRDHCAGEKVVYWASKTLAKVPMRVDDNNRIVFNATLDGHEVEATIDTNSARTTLRRPVADSVFDITETSPGAKPIGNGERFHYRFGKLTLDGLVVTNPDIMIVPDAATKMPKRGGSHLLAGLRVHQGAPLRLGMSTLRQLHIYIDYHNQTLYITPAKPELSQAAEPLED